MSKKIFRSLAKVAGVVALVAGTVATGGALGVIGAGIAGIAGSVATIASVVTLGSSLLGKPKAVAMNNAALDRLNASINPRAPHMMVFGRTAMATEIRDQEFTGNDKEYLHRFFVVASHKVNSVQQIWFDDKLAWTSTGGVQGEFAGYLTVAVRTEGTPGNAINISSRMGSSRRFTGLAYVQLRYKLTGNSKKTESPFAQQVPTRMTIVGEGIPCYDPRQDSTVPGGSGSHRANNQATWTYGAHARNPACQLATWLLGWRIQNPATSAWRLIVGKGIPADRIDWASFIEAANLCDEPVAKLAGGTEPRYRGDGIVTEADDPMQVVEAFKACMNADLDDQDGLLRITVFHNDLATPDADLGDDDIEGAYTWIQTPSLAESFNVVRGGYIEPSDRSLYQQAEYSEARLPSPDGIDRIHPADFSLVQSKSQAERLAKQRLQRQQYGGTFRATFLATGWKVQKNSVVRLTCGSQGWTNKLFRVVETAVQFDGLVPMVLREEHPAIYAWDKEEGPAPQIAEPTYYAPGEAPIPQFLGTIEEGATVGAPPGTPVGDRPAEQVISALDQLDADMAAADSAIAAAESHITELLGDMAAAEAAILGAQGDIANVQSTVATLGSAVSTNSTAITNLEGNYASLTSTVSTLSSAVTTQGTAISTLESNYATLSSTVAALGSSVSTQATAISTLESNYAGLTSTVVAQAGGLLRNPRFSFWEVGQINPPGWRSSGAVAWERTAGANGLGYAVLYNASPGQFSMLEAFGGSNAGLGAIRAGWYIVEIDLRLNNGGLTHLQYYLQGTNAERNAELQAITETFDAIPDETGVAPGYGVIGKEYQFRRLVHITNTDVRSANLLIGTFGGDAVQGKHITLRYANVRPATPQEIRDQTVLAPLQATVTTQATTLASHDSLLASLSSSVSAQGLTVSQHQTAIDGMAGRWGVAIDVNGRVVGRVKLDGTGQTSTFDVLSDAVRFMSPGGGPSTTYANGVWRVDTGSVMLAYGTPFGSSNQFIQWYGPTQTSLANCTEGNALFYLKADGTAYFGGVTRGEAAQYKKIVGSPPSTSFSQIGPTLMVFTGSGTVDIGWDGTARPWGGTGNQTYELKWQVSADQSSWSDVGAAASGGVIAESPFFPASPAPPLNRQATGLPAASVRYFRIVARRVSSNAEFLTLDGSGWAQAA